jgi:hypothetical protein
MTLEHDIRQEYHFIIQKYGKHSQQAQKASSMMSRDVADDEVLLNLRQIYNG